MSTPTTHSGIIVGVDGSPPSKVAVDWAAREASMRELPLTIIYVSSVGHGAGWSPHACESRRAGGEARTCGAA